VTLHQPDKESHSMDDLLAAALLGTGKQSGTKAVSVPSLDALASQLGHIVPERRLLLLAGSRAVYQQAGRKCVCASTPPGPAAPDATPVCSPPAAALFEQFLNQDPIELRIEASKRLARAGQRLPAELVPQALNTRQARVREVLPPVLGTVGTWLSQFNPAWHWLTTTATQSTDANPEQVWTEGSLEQRKAVLATIRASQPELGRVWLEKAWPKEKAENKLSLLEAFPPGLSPSDEAFLEFCLTDRSQRVRAVAARLLARIGSPTFVSRMKERADVLFEYAAPGAGAGKRGTANEEGILKVTPPQKFDKAWEREGIAEKPPPGKGNRAFWLEQILELTPVSQWETKFRLGPAQLVALVSGSEFADAVLLAWSTSAIFFNCQNWLPPLWDYWITHQQAHQPDQRTELLSSILEQIPPEMAELRIIQGLNENNTSVVHALWAYPQAKQKTWTEAVGAAYLAGARRAAANPQNAGQLLSEDLLFALDVAMVALPEACFAEALEPWEVTESADYLSNRWRRVTDQLVDVIGARKRFAEAVSLSKPEETPRGQKQK
jgi:hypothetical protein